MLGALIRILTGGALDRVLDTVDRKISAETDREAVKAEIIREAYRNRAGFMKAGGFVLMLLFALPLAFWFGSVCLYSVFWCADCVSPAGWTIAALPAPLDEWAGWVLVSIFGVLGVTGLRK